jgi:hypothetical protein
MLNKVRDIVCIIVILYCTEMPQHGIPSEAQHLAHLLACHGYLFPIDDHQLTVKNDGTFYRLQTPYFWPSNCWEPENTDYGLYEL